jgi:hypothetical protein
MTLHGKSVVMVGSGDNGDLESAIKDRSTLGSPGIFDKEIAKTKTNVCSSALAIAHLSFSHTYLPCSCPFFLSSPFPLSPFSLSLVLNHSGGLSLHL